MSAQMFYPIDVIAEMTPLTLNEPSPGVYVLDFGQVRRLRLRLGMRWW